MDRPVATFSMDLDNQWAYMKAHGDRNWKEFPSYLDRFVPTFLELFDSLSLRTTLFVVGQDLMLANHANLFQQIVEAGHEIANHTFSHEPWVHLQTRDEISEEVGRTEELILKATGFKTVGFRGPGFNWSNDLLEVLAEKGYLYDASSFPTFVGPIARSFYFAGSNLTPAEKERLRGLYGEFRDGFRPLEPYRWKLGSGARILEIPVTTVPVLRLPFHMTYLTYLACRSSKLAKLYLKMAQIGCQITGTEPSFLLHPLDFLGADSVPELAYFPGMDLSTEEKVSLVKEAISMFNKRYRLVPMGVYAESILAGSQLVSRKPDRGVS